MWSVKENIRHNRKVSTSKLGIKFAKKSHEFHLSSSFLQIRQFLIHSSIAKAFKFLTILKANRTFLCFFAGKKSYCDNKSIVIVKTTAGLRAVKKKKMKFSLKTPTA
jgi:hypothetical protein